MELSNVISADLTIRIQRMASYSWYLDFYDTLTGAPLDPTTFVDVRMTLLNNCLVEMLSYRIGEGFTIETELDSGRKVLVIDKAYTEDNLPPGEYEYDILVVRGHREAEIPLKGKLIYVKNISR